MSKRLAVLTLAFLPLPVGAATESYTFDPLHTSVSFSIDHLGLSLIHGRFSKYSGKFSIEGNLTLLGVTKPVALTVERFKCNPATASAKERCGGIVVGKIKRSEFGMKRGIPSIGDEVFLAFGFEGDKD